MGDERRAFRGIGLMCMGVRFRSNQVVVKGWHILEWEYREIDHRRPQRPHPRNRQIRIRQTAIVANTENRCWRVNVRFRNPARCDICNAARMKILSIAALSISAALLVGVVRAQQKCPAPPALSAPAGTDIFNAQQELDLGDVEAEWLEKNFRVIHDDELAEPLNVITNRILAQLPPTQLKFRVILIDSPIVNSFSVGAGRIYVTRKMVAFLRNEDELAGMLGHEMGHILTHQNAIEMTRTFHDILGVNSVSDRKDIFDKFNRMLDTIARDRGALVKTAERQEREEEPHQYEADRVALYAAAAAGFSPQAFVEFYDRLALTQGRTGNLLTDIFQVTKPGEKRLRELHKSETLLPASCREIAPAAPSAEFLAWQSEVIAYSGFGHREHLVGAVSKKPLDPPLRTDIRNLKFSPDGQYSLAQDDANVFVFANDPLTFLFRINAADAHEAQFSPDSQKILLLTHGLRIEEWNIDDQERTAVHEMALPDGCTQSSLSHDGKLVACVSHQLDFSLIDVESGNALLTKKAYFEPDVPGPMGDYLRRLTLILAETSDGKWIHMAFSPDDHYFAATGSGKAIGVDVSNRTQIPLHGALGDMLKGTFAFLGPDRVIVQNRSDPKNSAVMEFSTGKVLERVPISPRQDMEAPTRGDYVILKPVKDAQVGVLDLKSQNFVIGSTKSSAIDVYDAQVITQRESGEVAMFDIATHARNSQLELPKSALGSMRAWTVSPDLRWLAVSGTSRGAVWDLSASKRLYYTRGFRGAYFDGNQAFYADFPKEDPQERTIARAELSRESMAAGTPIEEKTAVWQSGRFLILRKSAGKENSLARNMTLDVQDVRDGHTLWSRTFPKEAPFIAVTQQTALMVLEWRVEAAAAKDEIKDAPALQARFAAMRDHQGAYLLEVLDAASGKLRGQLLIDTGKGSFRLTSTFAEGDWVLVADNENRTRAYSLSTGEQKAIFFGASSALSTAAGIAVVENQRGQLDVYDLKSFEKRTQLSFPYHVSACAFSADGKNLFILTANQIAYTFDTQALDKPEATTAVGPNDAHLSESPDIEAEPQP
jgi:WD40 repeat protein